MTKYSASAVGVMAVLMSLSQNVVRDGVPHDNGRLFREFVLVTEDAE